VTSQLCPPTLTSSLLISIAKARSTVQRGTCEGPLPLFRLMPIHCGLGSKGMNVTNVECLLSVCDSCLKILRCVVRQPKISTLSKCPIPRHRFFLFSTSFLRERERIPSTHRHFQLDSPPGTSAPSCALGPSIPRPPQSPQEGTHRQTFLAVPPSFSFFTFP